MAFMMRMFQYAINLILEIKHTLRKDTRPIAESWSVPQQHPILGVSKL